MKVLIFYSGGKDSQASLIWAVKEYGVDKCEAVFCDTGWENPLTYDHIKNTTNQLGVRLVTLKSKYGGMVELVKYKKCWPQTHRRFCTEELKSKPAIDYVLSHTEHIIVIEGIRSGESFSRSKMQPQCTYFKYYFEPLINGKTHSYRRKDVLEWCKNYNADKIRPIFDLTAEQAINFIRDNGHQPNPLYFMGFHRVGCFPCIMSRHAAVKLIIENHPEQWNYLKQLETEIGYSFFPPEYIPKKFCTGNSKNGKSYPTAQDIERYIQGKNSTIDMFDQETQSCMSVYNLCE